MAKKAAVKKPEITLSPVNIELPFEVMMVDPNTIKANPENWRKHPQRQRQAYNALKSAVGWAGAALFNKRTGKLIDGHMRCDEAIRNKEKAVPVIVGDWSPEQETLIMTQLDPLAAMAQTNADALNNLLKKTNQKAIEDMVSNTNISNVLKSTLNDLQEHTASVELGTTPDILLDTKKRKYKEAVNNKDSSKYRSNDSVKKEVVDESIIFPLEENALDFPSLLPDKLCTVIPDKIWDRTPESVSPTSWFCYSAGKATFPSPEERQGGILGFYCDDWRFEVAWNDTADFVHMLLEQDWAGVALPDYSRFADWPLSVCIYNLYRSRWCGRFWQELGIPVIPLIQGCGRSEELTMEAAGSLPKKIPVAAIQCRTQDGTATYWKGFVELIALYKSCVKIDTLVIYGGLEHWKSFGSKLPKGINYVPINSFTAQRRKVHGSNS